MRKVPVRVRTRPPADGLPPAISARLSTDYRITTKAEISWEANIGYDDAGWKRVVVAMRDHDGRKKRGSGWSA